MKYTKHFGPKAKNLEHLNLSKGQFQRLRNILNIEAAILGLNKVKYAYKEETQYYLYDIVIFKENLKLTSLTGNLDPIQLLDEMIKISNSEHIHNSSLVNNNLNV